MILVGPVGPVSRGDVLDVNVPAFTRALTDMDSQLYVKWNPRKRQKNGVWEIRRRPDYKTPVFKCEYQGSKIYQLEYVEADLTHHVLDCPVLDYSVISKLKSMDMWSLIEDSGHHSINNVIDNAQAAAKEKANKELREETRYMAIEEKKAIREMKDMLLAGVSPGRFYSALGKLGTR